MLSCGEMLGELGRYLDDRAAAEARWEIAAHLAECRTCRVLYDSARKTLRIVTDARSFELSEEISSRILEKVMARLDAN